MRTKMLRREKREATKRSRMKVLQLLLVMLEGLMQAAIHYFCSCLLLLSSESER